MPAWAVHDKWALKLGISPAVSELVNRMVDFPMECEPFMRYCADSPDTTVYRHGRPVGKWHRVRPFRADEARGDLRVRNLQIAFAESCGQKHVLAFYLHQLLDYLVWWIREDPTGATRDNVLRQDRLNQRIGPVEDSRLQEVVSFVADHWEAIVSDCTGHMP